ncbi:MAG: putative lipoprotein [Blastococcus sp.]|jgi:hypothetical protein|nr:putative lipoprotein [Blastococcus sp.]
MRTRVASAAVLLLISGCSWSSDDEGERGKEPAARVVSAAPGERLTLVGDAEPVASAIGVSRALFDTAEVVVVVRDGDVAGTLLGASTAVGLGVPLLVEPREGGPTPGPVEDELERLGARTVVAVGAGTDRAGEGGRKELAVPAVPKAVEALTGVEFAAAEPVAEGEEVAAVARLDQEAPAALQPAGAEPPAASEDDLGSLPEVARGTPRPDTLVLATGGAESLPGIASALAAGARVQVTGDADPRASTDAGSALSEQRPKSVVAVGAAFGAEDGLDWKVEVAATGTQLPGGGQLLFPGRMLVALYGHPGSAALGVLGEQGIDASVQRARDLSESYESLVEAPVVPAFEIIATVASSGPGPDGNYSAEADPDDLRPWVEAAGKAGVYVVLDLQPGRSDFVTQAERYRSLLELPHVGLALDPEWRLGPNQVHLNQIGSVQIDEVNRMVTWLADLTRERALPQKLLVLHQFKLTMLPGRERLDTSRDELAVMVHVDGQGGQGDKQATWRVLHENAPAGLWWGWKNFYDEDAPMLTPEQTVAQVSPAPALISYQ